MPQSSKDVNEMVNDFYDSFKGGNILEIKVEEKEGKFYEIRVIGEIYTEVWDVNDYGFILRDTIQKEVV